MHLTEPDPGGETAEYAVGREGYEALKTLAEEKTEMDTLFTVIGALAVSVCVLAFCTGVKAVCRKILK